MLRYGSILFFTSLLAVAVSLAALVAWPLNFGVEFTGGSITEVSFEEQRPSAQELREQARQAGFSSVSVQVTEENSAILRTAFLDEADHQLLLRTVGGEEQRFSSIGPVIGKELRRAALLMAGLALLAVVLYVALAFRRVVRPLHSWQYGAAALLALFHDLAVPLGVFAVLGQFFGEQVTIPVLVGLLTVLGYSVNDTVVVFDRLRENLLSDKFATFEGVLAASLRQTAGRSVATSATTLLVLFAIFFFGGATLAPFALVLIIGVAAGTFSSLFLAPWVLLLWSGRSLTQ